MTATTTNAELAELVQQIVKLKRENESLKKYCDEAFDLMREMSARFPEPDESATVTVWLAQT